MTFEWTELLKELVFHKFDKGSTKNSKKKNKKMKSNNSLLVLSNILSHLSSSETTTQIQQQHQAKYASDEHDDKHSAHDGINKQFIEEIFESGEDSQRQLKEWIKGVYELEKSGKDSLMAQSSGMNKLLVDGYVFLNDDISET